MAIKSTEAQEASLNSVAWDNRHEPPISTQRELESRSPPRGPKTLPGTYTVKMTVGDE